MVTNEHQYVTKMALSASMRGLWGDFITIFWTVECLQRLIYIWNKISKHIMSQHGMFFQSILLHIMYNFQHFEPIQYVNGLSKSLPTFQINDPKVIIYFNDFPFVLKSMVQQPCIQLLQVATYFYWNEKIDFALMDILKDNRN